MTIPEAAQLVIQAGSLAKGGDVFVLDMGKPIKILDLAEKMIKLSGFKPLLDSRTPVESNEINIITIGLRPGEKLYEELTHSGNLLETIHPRIKRTVDKPIAFKAMKTLMRDMSKAIQEDNQKSLQEILSSVTNKS